MFDSWLLSALVAVLVAYVIKTAFFSVPTRLYGVYTQPVVWWLYWPRWIWCVLEIWSEQVSRPKRLDNGDDFSEDYNFCGIEPTTSEEELEKPKSLTTDRHEDSMFVWGADSQGRALVARLERLTRRRAGAMIILQDSQGHQYTLPQQPDTTVYNTLAENPEEENSDGGGGGGGGCWSAAGLRLECIEPMRIWRITFNGLLRRGGREEYSDHETPEEEDSIVHVRLHLLWKTFRKPVDVWRESSPGLLAHAIATQPEGSVDMFTSLDMDGYDQWGSLYGSVEIESQSKETWHMKGSRQHRWGMGHRDTNIHRSADIFTFLEDGTSMWQQALSFTSGITHCNFGYIHRPSGEYRALTKTDLSLPELGENGDVPENVLVRFKASGCGTEDLWHRRGPGIVYYSGDPWTVQHVVSVDQCATRSSKGWGLSIFSSAYGKLCPVPERASLPPLLEVSPTTDGSQAPLVVSLEEERCRSSKMVGGKGASLAFLKVLEGIGKTDQEFTVPRGVVVTTEAWRIHLEEHPEFKSHFRTLETKMTSVGNGGQAAEACNRTMEAISKAPVASVVASALTKTLDQVFPRGYDHRRFAVRSSGCNEDSSEASAAGQNETVLGCRTVDEVLKAIATCWASQFSFQSVQYRRQRGQCCLDDGMGVVVQEMVTAEASGVIFTRDPVTGHPGRITIAANYGLGESVVAAKADPDTYILKRTWSNSLRVSETIIGRKAKRTVMRDNACGTQEEEVLKEDSDRGCLKDEVALALGRVAIYIEDGFGSSRDIEFAVQNGHVYLLQARPITSLFVWTEQELIHEMDTGLPTDLDVLTKANVGEVLPGSISHLTLSLLPKIIDAGIKRESYFISFFEFIPGPHQAFFLRSVSTHTFLSIIEMLYRNTEPEISVVTQSMEFSVVGHIISKPEFHEFGVRRYGLSKYTQFFKSIWAFCLLAFASRATKHLQAEFQNISIDPSRFCSADVLYQEICRRLPDMIKIAHGHAKAGSASAMTQVFVTMCLVEGKKDLSLENIKDLALLLSSCSQVESADVPKATKVLAHAISNDEELEDFLVMTLDEGKVWLSSHPGVVGDLYRKFLAKHGHRCYKEFDLLSLPWGLDPRGLVANLQTMVKNPASLKTSREELTVDRAIESMATPVSHNTKRALRFLVPICRNFVADRETTKSVLIKGIDAFRRAYRQLGQLMVSEWRIPDADLIFFLTHREIGQLLKSRSPTLIAKATQRRRLQPQLEKLQFSEIICGLPMPEEHDDDDDLRERTKNIEDGRVVIQGTPVCLGMVSGTAKVITSLQDIGNLEVGDILVTVSTDIGWSPYFPLLAGVVTEIGGLVSHGAVVAREYGLPCVVGCRGITRILQSGDRIVLNAVDGTIFRLGNLEDESAQEEEEDQEERRNDEED
ncbi:rifampicin phosphotransferase [Oratosquilla oratoria]|uniref:rifampicin phosphotransferase n=1 Tax=Oratosquilla oratoria TaxID=337810 RepID=UPI003F774333